MTKFEKETRHRLYVFIKKKQQLTRRNARQQRTHMTRFVQLHGHDVLTVPLTVLLYCPITGTTRTLSHWCSNRAGTNQTRSRTLLKLWLIHLHFENDEFFKRCCLSGKKKLPSYQCWMASVALANFSCFKIEMNQWKHFNIPSLQVAQLFLIFFPVCRKLKCLFLVHICPSQKLPRVCRVF